MVGVITERWRQGSRYVIHFKADENFGEGQPRTGQEVGTKLGSVIIKKGC
jgi:hypothetical protein